jgi:hypothetical protein
MKKIVVLIVAILTSSCEIIQYEGETKLVIKGIVNNENNQPIVNQDIKLVVSTENTLFFSESNFIGRTTTKSDGSYTMVIPKPTNFNQIEVEVNTDDNLLNKKIYSNIKLNNFINYKLNLAQTKLYPKTNLSELRITTNPMTPNYQLQKLEYIGEIANEIELLNPYDDADWTYNTNVKVKKNQIVVLKYTIKVYGTNQIITNEVSIPIGNEGVTNYTLTY